MLHERPKTGHDFGRFDFGCFIRLDLWKLIGNIKRNWSGHPQNNPWTSALRPASRTESTTKLEALHQVYITPQKNIRAINPVTGHVVLKLCRLAALPWCGHAEGQRSRAAAAQRQPRRAESTAWHKGLENYRSQKPLLHSQTSRPWPRRLVL